MAILTNSNTQERIGVSNTWETPTDPCGKVESIEWIRTLHPVSPLLQNSIVGLECGGWRHSLLHPRMVLMDMSKMSFHVVSLGSIEVWAV